MFREDNRLVNKGSTPERFTQFDQFDAHCWSFICLPWGILSVGRWWVVETVECLRVCNKSLATRFELEGPEIESR